MITRILGASVALWTLVLAIGDPPNQTRPPETTIATTTTTSSTTSSSTSTSTTPDRGAHDELQEHLTELEILDEIDESTPCRHLLPLAIEAGWPADKIILEQLAWIAHKETRCQNITPADSRWNGHDTGILQVNEIHTDYVEQIYQEPFLEAMADPWKNLNFAWILYSGREEIGKCGWQPWRISCE